MVLEIVNAEAYHNAILPTLFLTVRAENSWGTGIRGGMSTCEVLFSEVTGNKFIGQTSFQLPALTFGTSVKISFRFPFNRETLYYIDKFRGDQSDVNFTFGLGSMLLTESTDTPVLVTSDVSNYRIGMSDWHKFTSPWGNQAILLPVTPQSMTKIEELTKAGIGFRNLDEIVEDAHNRHLVYGERKGSKPSEENSR
jgi:hypothetical protein